MAKKFLILLLFVFLSYFAVSQNVAHTKQRISELCSEKYFGRGYIYDGINKAADYLAEEFQLIGIQSFTENSFFQNYSFDINTFPEDAVVKINDKYLKLGEDFILNADSPSLIGNYKLFYIDSTTQNDINKFDNLLKSKKLRKCFLVVDKSAFYENNGLNNFLEIANNNSKMFVGIILLISEELVSGLSQHQNQFPRIIIKKEQFSLKTKNISVSIQSKLLKNFPNKNVIGYIEGEVKDSFFVFSAHYDHIGGLGKTVFISGAQDNASGTALVLDLADFFSKNKPKYSVAFMLFSGEEVGLLGSSYYVENPLFDLKNIKFLFNLDLVGTGDDGFTLVNGDIKNVKNMKILPFRSKNTNKDTEIYEKKFNNIENFEKAQNLILKINENNNYFPTEKIKLRGGAANSDHYPFFINGVPCFYIYTLGGKTYYHNIKDKPETLNFGGYNQLFNLLTNFINQYE